MKNNPYEHILTPDKIPNALDEDFQLEEASRSLSLLEFSRQNKDLTARLSVQLRRNAELEAQIKKLGDRINSLRNQNEELSNNSLKNRELLKINDQEMSELREQLKQTEIELGQISLLYKNLEVTHEQGLSKTDKALRRHKRYKKRVAKWVRPLINRLATQNYALLKQLNDYKQTSTIQKEQLETERKLRENQQNKHKSTLNKAADLQDEIIMTYEAERKQLQSLLDQRDVELKDSEDRRRFLESIRDKYVHMENKAIAAERMRFEIERSYDDKISELRKEILKLKDEHQSEKEELSSTRKLLDILKQDNDELSKKYLDSASLASGARGQNQADFVQIGELKASKKSLEKQVAELKSQLNAFKEENRELRTHIDDLENPPKIPEVKPAGLVENKTAVAQLPTEEPAMPLAPEQNDLAESFVMKDMEFEEFQEIDRLIKEIEVGYPIKAKENLEK